MGLILIRYAGEIGIKGKNRKFFVRRLRRNIRDALKKNDLKSRIWEEGLRMFVDVEGEDDSPATDVLRRVFGIASLSPVQETASELEAIRREALAIAERIPLKPYNRFRIRARRADKTFPYTSPEINRLVGESVQQASQAQVDLSDETDVTIGIEVRQEGTFLYGETIPGPGGLPLGTQGRAFVLMSGGIDSPVAAWLMMRRGCGIIPVHFAQSEIEKEKALHNCQVLSQWSYGWKIKPLVLDHEALLGPIAEKLYDMDEQRWTCVFCKRAMIHKAEELAPSYHVHALVMGDSLGQVASQTIENMTAITRGSTLPILRPLIAYDKQEIIALARQIGTYHVSTEKSDTCRFVPTNPITRADQETLADLIRQLEDVRSI